jgi:transcriptional regulator with XRE-family HTH domain
MTQQEVADAMEWSLSKLIRIESGQVNIAINDLKVLVAHYKITDDKRVAELLTSARGSRERSWWSTYQGVAAKDYLNFIGYESSASHIRNFEPILVPGLLQTEDYAREVIRASPRQGSTEYTDKLLELRSERQERVLTGEFPKMYFVLDEAVVRRIVGRPETMRDQLRHLLILNERDNIDVLVVPFKDGLHILSNTPMVHFEFAGPDDEDVLYFEGPFGDLMLSREESSEAQGPSVYLDHFWTVEALARRYDATALIENALVQLSH